MIYRRLLIVILFLPSLATGQNKAKLEAAEKAREHAVNLKQGVLLVRLNDNKNRIANLKERGYKEKAEEIRKQQEEENQEIIAAFKRQYQYSDYYFFYSSSSKQLKNGQLDSILRDDSLNIVQATIDSNYYVLDPYHFYIKDMNSIQRGMSILDDQMNQLKDPFPYHVRKRQAFFFLRRDYFKMVALLDEQLDAFLLGN